MRTTRHFFADIIRKPPLLFPLIGLFHILWLTWSIWDDRREPIDVAWLQVVWMVAYTFFWIAVCDMRKWGAFGYFALTLIDLGIYIAARNGKVDRIFISDLFLVDALFSFFILVYYRRLI